MDDYTAEEDLEAAEDLDLLAEGFDAIADDLEGISQLRINEEGE